MVHVGIIVTGELQAVIHGDTRNAQQELQEQRCTDFSPRACLNSAPAVLFDSTQHHPRCTKHAASQVLTESFRPGKPDTPNSLCQNDDD